MSGPGLHQSFHQRQTQQLVLAPQMRQSLKILQVAALDLRAAIQEELQSNPALEELPMDDISLEKAAGKGDEQTTPSDDSREEMDFSKDPGEDRPRLARPSVRCGWCPPEFRRGG